jgi:hypothetical protein
MKELTKEQSERLKQSMKNLLKAKLRARLKTKGIQPKKSEQPQKPDTSLASKMLTPSEIEQLRLDKKDLADYEPEAFAHLQKK